MSEPTPNEIATLALRVQETHLDWNQTKCLQYAYNLWENARQCIENNRKPQPARCPKCGSCSTSQYSLNADGQRLFRCSDCGCDCWTYDRPGDGVRDMIVKREDFEKWGMSQAPVEEWPQ